MTPRARSREKEDDS